MNQDQKKQFQPRQVSRRPARVFAMQLLYAMKLSGGTIAECMPGVLAEMEVEKSMQQYGIALVEFQLGHAEEIDKIIAEASVSWALERIAVVDLCVLRMALSELMSTDIPVKVAMTEAAQIATKFSTADSGKFVTGILNCYAESKNLFGSGPKEESN